MITVCSIKCVCEHSFTDHRFNGEDCIHPVNIDGRYSLCSCEKFATDNLSLIEWVAKKRKLI
jgi:hypothetical protein